MDRRDLLRRAAALPLVLAFDPESVFERPRPAPVALVTADLEATVIVVDTRSGHVLGRIATEAGPRSIERVGSNAVIAHTESGLVSVLEGSSLAVRAMIDGFVEPRYTAAAPDGRHAYVTDSGRNDVAVLDLELARVIARVPVGGPARHVSLCEFGALLWVALGTKADEIAVLDVTDAAAPRLIRRFRPPFRAHDVGFAPGCGIAWVTSGAEPRAALYDGCSGKIMRTFATGTPPQHVTFLEGSAYLTSGDDGTLQLHGASDAGLVRSVRVPVGSYNVQQAEGVIVTPSLDRGTLWILDADGSVRHRLRPARSSHDACILPRFA